MSALKKPMSFEEQIEHLKNFHNLTINDYEKALYILKHISYYRLSAYGIGLYKKDDREKFRDGISIETLFRLYSFDSKLRILMFHIIEKTEIGFKTQIAFFHSMKYGSEGYMDAGNFSDRKNKSDCRQLHGQIIESFKKECFRQKNKPFVRHHNENYDGHFPLWAAVELFTFGNIVSFYWIMKPEDRKTISAEYNTTPEKLNSWLAALIDIRNICAHYGRLYNMVFTKSPSLYKENLKYSSHKLFPVILTLKRIYIYDTGTWINFLTELISLIEEYEDVINLSFMGFPADWKEVLSKDKNI